MDSLPYGWTKQWSDKHQRFFFVNTLSDPVESSWDPPPMTLDTSRAQSSTVIDPGLLSSMGMGGGSSGGAASRPYVLQGSLWSGDASSASLTPWSARGSPAHNVPDLVRNSFDGASTPSDYSDSIYPYRGETGNSFAHDPLFSSSSGGRPMPMARQRSPMLGYSPTPTGAVGSMSPWASAGDDFASMAAPSFASASLFPSVPQSMPSNYAPDFASTTSSAYGMGLSPYSSMAGGGSHLSHANEAYPALSYGRSSPYVASYDGGFEY